MGIRHILLRGLEFWRTEGLRSFSATTVAFIRRRIDQRRYGLRQLLWRVWYGEAAPSPTELIHVDPTEIERIATGHRPFSAKQTTIVDGDWDRRHIDIQFASERQVREQIDGAGVARLEQYAFFESAHQHFEHGVPWEETWFYQYKLESGEGGYYGSEKKISQRLAEFDKLYQSVRQGQYLSQRELQEAGTVPLEKEVTSPPELGEVAVAIGRDGEILHVDGRHRLAVAQLLEVGEIPVRIVARHREWQRLRRRIAAADEPEAELDGIDITIGHPDLCQLVG